MLAREGPASASRTKNTTSAIAVQAIPRTTTDPHALNGASPLGGDSASTWEALSAGRSGVRLLDEEWAATLPVRIAARIAVEPGEVIPRPQARKLDRSAQFALIAAREAWADAGFTAKAGEDPAVVDAVWRGEALGTLLWALQLAELPAYDEPFRPEEVAAVDLEGGVLREADEILSEQESARLWHWRARTTAVQAEGTVDLSGRYASFDQLIAATAMRGYELGLLPAPMRGDFAAFGKIYRHLAPEQHQLALSIALERHHALNWLAGLGDSWDAVPLDT